MSNGEALGIMSPLFIRSSVNFNLGKFYFNLFWATLTFLTGIHRIPFNMPICKGHKLMLILIYYSLYSSYIYVKHIF